jgi:hypothetical protein
MLTKNVLSHQNPLPTPGTDVPNAAVEVVTDLDWLFEEVSLDFLARYPRFPRPAEAGAYLD